MGIMFKPELAAKVMSGEKTVTRRLVSDIGRATVVSVCREPLGFVDAAEARREGFGSVAEFVAAFVAINGEYNSRAQVWRVELKAVSA